MLLFFKKEGIFLLPVWLLFVAATCAAGWSLPGWDLTAGYVAGRLVAGSQGAHIYDQAGSSTMPNPASPWARAAAAGGIADGITTPYVQTPLYAWAVAPLAGRIEFATFRHVFLVLTAAAAACLVFLAAWGWAPALAAPVWQAGVLAGLFFSVPNMAAVALGQTHIVFLLLAVLAIVAAQHGRPGWAGAALAVAACVKISPGWVALAWLAAGEWRAAAWFAAWSVALLGAAWGVAGAAVFGTFLHILAVAGGAAPLTFNNDSLAAVLLGGRLTPALAFTMPGLVVLPGWVKLASAAALSALCVAAGWLDRHGARGVGAIMALVAATSFTPLAWNHYYIVLAVPVVLMLGAARRRRMWGVVVAAVAALVYPPLAYAVHAPLWVVALRSEFWAAALCLVAMPFLPVHLSDSGELGLAPDG